VITIPEGEKVTTDKIGKNGIQEEKIQEAFYVVSKRS